LTPQIVEPIFAFWQQCIGDESIRFSDRRESIMALALADPHRAAEWAIAFDEKLSDSRRRYIPQPWEVVVETLTGDREEVSKAITRSDFHHWVIDEYDF
ncbi:MAG: hypothetical protein AAF961_13245, partial [Planctomycetota bacterium]